ncbi:AraC family transcriptional regulator N-terminal domain-containing protein [Agrobacterium deltaense]
MTFQTLLDAQLAIRMAQAPAGIFQTEVEGVRLFWTVMSTQPEPLVYDAGIVVVLRGRKEGQLGERSFVYDEDNYLVLTLPMPFLCAHRASRAEPLCGLFVSATRDDFTSLLGQMADVGPISSKSRSSGLAPAPVDWRMRSTIERLVSVLDDALAGRLIGPTLRRELLFHALRGPCGPALVAYAQQTGDDGKLDKLIEDVQRDISRPVTIGAMAASVAMSVTTFHRAFRQRTGQSPLQYVKRLRLHAARDMIAFDGARIGEAAQRVGYESTPQFSREFKRHFGVSARDYQETASLIKR